MKTVDASRYFPLCRAAISAIPLALTFVLSCRGLSAHIRPARPPPTEPEHDPHVAILNERSE